MPRDHKSKVGKTDLVFYPDSAPGIRRQRRGRGFTYISPDGTRIDATEERHRIKALAVPPAYEDVWICPKPNGYLQATGRDARTRKQYRYHPDWTAFRDERKFDGLVDFGRCLPRLRRHILDDLRGTPGDRNFAIAAVLALLDRASIRVGHPDYTRENKTFGATTLQNRHVTLDGSDIKLSYTAKGGQQVRKTIRDATLNRTLSRLDDLPGRALVSWVDRSGRPHQVTSDAVNERLQSITGENKLTAKTFRTWNGSAAAIEAAAGVGPVTIKALSEAAAERLHNTPAVALKSYIHPSVVALAKMSDERRASLLACDAGQRGLRRAESSLLHLLTRD